MTVVFKIGGSILNQAGLVEKLRFVLDLRPESTRILVTGGGKAADIVREWDRIHGLSDESAHRLAITAMDFNTELLADLLPTARVTDGEDLDAEESESVLLRAGPFLTRHESRPESGCEAPIAPLPAKWDVTADSIAAWISIILAADELVLVKSCPPPVSVTSGVAVDSHLEMLAHRIPRIGWVDFTETTPVIHEWRTSVAPHAE